MRREEEEPSEGRKIMLFIGFTLGIYGCFLVGSIFEERMYSTPHSATNYPTPGTEVMVKATSSQIN